MPESVAGVDRLTRVESQIDNVLTTQGRQDRQLDEIYKILRGRPSWAVATIMGLLSTGFGVTLTALVMQPRPR